MKAFFVFTVLMALVAAVLCRPQEKFNIASASGGPNVFDGIQRLIDGAGASITAPAKALKGDPSGVLEAIAAIQDGIQTIVLSGLRG